MCGIKIPEALAWPTNENDNNNNNNNTGLPSPHQAVWSLMNLVWLHMSWISTVLGLCWLQMSPRLSISAGWRFCLPATHILPCKLLVQISLRVCVCIYNRHDHIGTEKTHPLEFRCRALKHTHTFQKQSFSWGMRQEQTSDQANQQVYRYILIMNRRCIAFVWIWVHRSVLLSTCIHYKQPLDQQRCSLHPYHLMQSNITAVQ